MTEEKKSGQEVGKISHFFAKIGVGIIELSKELKVGDKIAINGATTQIEQTVESLELDHKSVESAKAGEAVGIKVTGKVREGDAVCKL